SGVPTISWAYCTALEIGLEILLDASVDVAWIFLRVAVKASEAYARGTLASVRSRLRTWDAALRHLEKAGVVKRDPRPGFLTPAVLRKTVAYLCLKSAALYGSAALGRHKKHYEVHPSLVVGPLAPWERLLVTGVWHLLRADELASLRVGDVVFVTVEGRPTAALRVARSKTDQAGHGTVVARALDGSPVDELDALSSSCSSGFFAWLFTFSAANTFTTFVSWPTALATWASALVAPSASSIDSWELDSERGSLLAAIPSWVWDNPLACLGPFLKSSPSPASADRECL
ncbi:unnamed protein product, partial [Symbiodinium sp. KB8]